MSANGQNKAFPLPSEIETAPGCEGWEEMYPYYTHFTPEDDDRFWFYNGMHFPEPMPAFDAITALVPYAALGQFNTRYYAIPGALGIDHRIVNGRIYIGANAVTDPAEIEKRLKLFEKRAFHYFGNWNDIYDNWQKKLNGLIADLEAIEVPPLANFEDEDKVLDAHGLGQNYYVLEAYNRCIEGYHKMWMYHFELLVLGYGAYLTLFEFCKKAFPEIPDQTVSRMVSGVDTLMFRPDDELKRLAKLALSLEIDGLFTAGDSADTILERVRQAGNAGAEWLAELEKARDPWFHVSTGDGFYHHHLAWNDDLSVPFSTLPAYIAQLKDGRNLDRPTAKLREDRDRIVAEYRALLNSDEERGAFDQMIGLARTVFPYVEDHKFYCEHWYTTAFFNKIRVFGRLMSKAGLIEDAEDIFQLREDEVRQALSDMLLHWGTGAPARGRAHWPAIVARRKQIIEKMKQWSPPPALGKVPEAILDPMVLMLWGVTSEQLKSWSTPPDKINPNELRGFGASSGVAEGPARVITDVADIANVQEGEILVCPVTAPSWAPVFSRIRAAVSDIGGTMSHAAIVAREYGMPAVVGTGHATKRIRTGQRVRVDGDSGIVELVD